MEQKTKYERKEIRARTECPKCVDIRPKGISIRRCFDKSAADSCPSGRSIAGAQHSSGGIVPPECFGACVV